MELVTPAIGLIFWTAVVFILLVILLKKFAWKPILTAVEDRNESIENALKAAEKAKEDIENLTADNERILNEAKLERDALMTSKDEEITGIKAELNETSELLKESIENITTLRTSASVEFNSNKTEDNREDFSISRVRKNK
jgi:F-type H+-transporting ATPase subunit b